MPNKLKPRNLRNKLLTVLIVLIAAALGLCGGIYYSDHYRASVKITKSDNKPIVCNCPDIPVGGNPGQYCKC